MHEVFSVAQIFGYFAFFFGVGCFLQKSDLRFRILLACESVCYVVHFWLLGNLPATASAGVSMARTLTSLRTRSRWAALFFVLLLLCLGFWLVRGWLGVLPIVASSIGTTAVFLYSGITMRWMMLSATLLWLINNIVSGSIGGTALEACIAVANFWTIWRLRQSAARGVSESSSTQVH